MQSMLASSGDVKESIALLGERFPLDIMSCQTLNSQYQALVKRTQEGDEKHYLEDIEYLEISDHTTSLEGGRSLTPKKTQDYLQAVARTQDNSNRGMTRKEMIGFIL